MKTITNEGIKIEDTYKQECEGALSRKKNSYKKLIKKLENLKGE